MGLLRWLARKQGKVVVGTITLTLYGDMQADKGGVEIYHEVTDEGEQAGVDDFMLLTRGWLLFIESQLGKLPPQLYDLALQSLLSLAVSELRREIYESSKATDVPPECKLATVTVEVWAGRDWFVLVHLKTSL